MFGNGVVSLFLFVCLLIFCSISPTFLLFSILFPIAFNCVLLFSKRGGGGGGGGRKLQGAKIQGSRNLKGIANSH